MGRHAVVTTAQNHGLAPRAQGVLTPASSLAQTMAIWTLKIVNAFSALLVSRVPLVRINFRASHRLASAAMEVNGIQHLVSAIAMIRSSAVQSATCASFPMHQCLYANMVACFRLRSVAANIASGPGQVSSATRAVNMPHVIMVVCLIGPLVLANVPHHSRVDSAASVHSHTRSARNRMRASQQLSQPMALARVDVSRPVCVASECKCKKWRLEDIPMDCLYKTEMEIAIRECL